MAEVFANNFRTTVGAGGITAGALSLPVADAAPVALQGGEFRIVVGTQAEIDAGTAELMLASGGASPWTVVRGVEGTTAAAHAAGAVVAHTLTAGSLAVKADVSALDVVESSAAANAAAIATKASQAALDAEIARALGVEATNATAITDEATARTTADSTHAATTTTVHGVADTAKLAVLDAPQNVFAGTGTGSTIIRRGANPAVELRPASPAQNPKIAFYNSAGAAAGSMFGNGNDLLFDNAQSSGSILLRPGGFAQAMKIAPTGQTELNVQGSAGGLLIGGDAALYRSAVGEMSLTGALRHLAAGTGPILKSPDGLVTKMVTINNSGALTLI